MKTYRCKQLAQLPDIGQDILRRLTYPACVYLHGEMGVGKTTLAQAIIQAAGYHGTVTSPTYNLIHEYPVAAGVIYHMDLYRLDDPGELEFLGLKDLWTANSLFLVEWPEKGREFLQPADYHIRLRLATGPAAADNGQNGATGRPRIIELDSED